MIKILYKLKKDGKFKNIEVECTEMYLQRDVHDDFEDCYVYVDMQGNYYIEETNNEFRYFGHKIDGKTNYDLFIPLVPLAGKDLEIINDRYNVNLGGDE